MSIRLKMILGIVAVFALGAIAAGQYLTVSYHASVQRAAADAIAQGAAIFKQAEQADAAKLSSVNLALQQDARYRDAFASGNRDELLALTSGVFGELKSDFGITHWYFETTPPEGSVFLRVHKPEQFDDTLKRKTYLEASEGETVSAGLELGATAVALRVVRPYYNAEGTALIGYMETGQEIDSILAAVKQQTGDDVGLLLSKQSMDASGWAALRTSKGLENNWDDQAEVVLAGSTDEALAAKMTYDKAPSNVPDTGEVIGAYEEDGRQVVRGVFPVKDAVGETIGLVYMQHDITAQASQLKTSQRNVLMVVVGMMIVVLALVILFMNKLVFGRLNTMIEHMVSVSKSVAGGDYEVTYEKTGADDEIGKFETFFGNFISLVGGALKQLAESRKN